MPVFQEWQGGQCSWHQVRRAWKRSQQVGGFVDHCKNLGFNSELGSLCFNRINIAIVLRRDLREARQKLGG